MRHPVIAREAHRRRFRKNVTAKANDGRHHPAKRKLLSSMPKGKNTHEQVGGPGIPQEAFFGGPGDLLSEMKYLDLLDR